MILASWYVALRHTFPTELPPSLSQDARRVRFARWLVMTGRLNDFGRFPRPLEDPQKAQSNPTPPALTIA